MMVRTVRAYFNGQVIGGEASTLNTIAVQHPFQIGNYSGIRATPGGDEFNGVIDDVVVYNEALAAQPGRIPF